MVLFLYVKYLSTPSPHPLVICDMRLYIELAVRHNVLCLLSVDLSTQQTITVIITSSVDPDETVRLSCLIRIYNVYHQVLSRLIDT